MKTNTTSHLSFNGYAQYKIKGPKSIRNFPAEPSFVCTMGDRAFLRSLPQLLKNDLKDDILIIHKKTDEIDSLAFQLSQKAYNKLYSIVYKGKKVKPSDGKIEFMSEYLQFIKPNNKIEQFTFELPKHDIDNLFADIENTEYARGNANCLTKLYIDRVYGKAYKIATEDAPKSIKNFTGLTDDIDKFFKKSS